MVNKKNVLIFNLPDDSLIKELTKKFHLNEDDQDLNLIFNLDGKIKTYKNCSFIVSTDGKKLQWFNDNYEGLLIAK